MVKPQKHIQAIGAQLLQERPGHAERPGLREVLLANTPVPAQLPANHLTHAVFMDAYAVPWLAERLRSGELLDTIHAYHQVCSDAIPGVLLGDPVIERGCLALRFSLLCEVLRQAIIDDLKKVVCHLETLEGRLRIKWLTLAGPIALGPVVDHLRQVVHDLEAELIR
ncbi:hypothetical protein [Deinococcus marmoris]|uniref:Uncharacterized protein n=1 Tax=Deinococcus marmoris TaxID=249408 RepID=A0A1U7NWD1_9DEIO|nr:hypothetical protein [Deinococcus marmoris]OLV17219.1 hypothetical protein BOO71_0009271 [Deinococcus marmoris]